MQILLHIVELSNRQVEKIETAIMQVEHTMLYWPAEKQISYQVPSIDASIVMLEWGLVKAVAGAGRKRSSGHLNVCTPYTRFEEEGRQGKGQAWAPSQENLRSPSLYLHQHPPSPSKWPVPKNLCIWDKGCCNHFVIELGFQVLLSCLNPLKRLNSALLFMSQALF